MRAKLRHVAVSGSDLSGSPEAARREGHRDVAGTLCGPCAKQVLGLIISIAGQVQKPHLPGESVRVMCHNMP